MGKTQETTPFYIVTRKGATFYVDTLQEALEEFVSNDGYRLTLTFLQKNLVIRRGDDWTPIRFGEKGSDASLVLRENRE